MLSRLFPGIVDNRTPGHWLGLVILGLVAFAKAGQGIQTIVHTRATAIGPDGINLTGLNGDQVDEVLSLFAVLGLNNLVLPTLSLVVLLRWRALVPFSYLMFITFFLANRLLHALHPSFAHEKAAFGLYINLGIFAVTVVGLIFALIPRGNRRAES